MWDFLAGAPSCMQTLHCGAKMLNGTEKAEHHKASLCVSCVSKLQLFHMWLMADRKISKKSWILNSDKTGEFYVFWKSPWSSTQLSVSSCFSKSHWVSYDQIQVMTRCWLQMQGSFFLVSHIAHNKPRLENLTPSLFKQPWNYTFADDTSFKYIFVQYATKLVPNIECFTRRWMDT